LDQIDGAGIAVSQDIFYALLVVTLVTFGSNVTPFIGASYTLLATYLLLNVGFSPGLYLALVVLTGLAAGLAKLGIYFGAFGFHTRLGRNRNVQLLGTWIGKKPFYVAVFLAAFIPILPLDDYLYIGAGANRAKLGPLFGVTLAAKVAKSSVEIASEYLGFLKLFGSLTNLGLSQVFISVILSAMFLILGILVYKIDWSRIVGSGPRSDLHES
jgi:hypothetical protein